MSESESARWARVKEVLADALERGPGERATYLEEACRGDAALRGEVEGLLERAEGKGALDRAAETLRAIAAADAYRPGDRIGRFTVVREIGRGGMGTVYLAEREGEDFEQRVAIKVVGTGIATPELSRRLRAERRLLARLDHPGIARFLDGDVAEDGRPYLVMEFVDGVPIDAFADDARLGIDERLDLFLGVLDAVVYAHHHLIVHQDIKPSNILARPDRSVKLLDFGVAGLLGEDGEGQGVLRGAHTPGYASPEQVRGEPGSLASDVYSLGVLLHVLLTGARPGPGGARASAGATPEAARVRGITVGELRSRLAGDLDAILARALEEGPAERYATAEQIARDVRAMREGRPVAAHPDRWGYRASKFVRRNRVPVVAAAAVFVALGVGLVTTSTQARRAQEQARIAAEERDLAEQVSDLLIGMFELSDPGVALGETIPAREILDRAVEEVDATLVDQPAARARMLTEIGQLYHNLGLLVPARDVVARSLDIQADGVASTKDVTRAMMLMADLTVDAGAYDDAAGILEETLALQRGEVAGAPADLVPVLSALATVYRELTRYEEAEALLDEALALLPDDDPESVDLRGEVLFGLALARHDEGDFDGAEEGFRRAMELLPSGDVETAANSPVGALARYRLGQLMLARRRNEEAERLFLEALEVQDRVLRADHVDRMATLKALGNTLVNAGRYTEAVALLEETLALEEGSVRLDPINRASTRLILGSALISLGREGESVDLLTSAVHDYEASFGAQHPYLITPAYVLSVARLSQDDLDGSHAAAEMSHRAAREAFGEDHVFAARAVTQLARIAAAAGMGDSATALARDAVDRALRSAGQDHRITVGAQVALGGALLDAGSTLEAEPLLRSALEAARSLEEGGSPLLASAELGLGRVLEALGRDEEARPHLLAAHEWRSRTLPPDHPDVLESLAALDRVGGG